MTPAALVLLFGSLRSIEGEFVALETVRVAAPSALLVDHLATGLRRRGIQVGSAGLPIELILSGSATGGAADQGYRLSLRRDAVVIRSPTERGLRYGSQALLALVDRADPGRRVPAVEVEDGPDLAWRGVTIDFRYARIGAGHFRKLIDRVEAARGNMIVVWLQREAGWTTHPELAGPRALPLSEWAALSDYAGARGIELVPYVDAYGHGETYLDHPAWVGLSRGEHGFWGGDDVQYCAAHPGSWRLFDDISRESASVFDDTQWFHVGMDEVGAQDERLCVICRARVARLAAEMNDTPPFPKARNRFVASRLHEAVARVRAMGRRTVFWDDSATAVGTLALGPGGIDWAPRSAVPMLWHYDADPARAVAALSRPGATLFETIIATGCADLENISRYVRATSKFPHVIGAVATIWEGDVWQIDRRLSAFDLALSLAWRRGFPYEAQSSLAGGVKGSVLRDPLDAAAWVPQNNDSPDPEPGPVLRLACPFAPRKDWRYLWDRAVGLDLGSSSGARLRIRADDPAALREVVFYVRSGDGWYRLESVHPSREWREVPLPYARALVEGKPAGWASIDGLRLSVVPAGERDVVVEIARLDL